MPEFKELCTLQNQIYYADFYASPQNFKYAPFSTKCWTTIFEMNLIADKVRISNIEGLPKPVALKP